MTSAQFTYVQYAPVVSSISPVSGGNGTQLTITGVNFFAGSTVNFVPVSSGTAFNNVVPITNGITSETITVTVPNVSTAQYYITVNVPSVSTSQQSIFAELAG